jgi:hypothetical protein
MARMIRKQFYIEPRHQAILKRMAKEEGVTEAEAIRRALDQLDAGLRLARAQRASAWDKEEAFIRDWLARGGVKGGRTWKRDDAYDRWQR